MAHLERQLVEQPVHQGGAVAVQEPHEPDFTLLRVALGESESLRALELAAQRLVLPLGRLNHLVVQDAHFVLQFAECRLHRPLEGRVDQRYGGGDGSHALVDCRGDRRQRLVDGGRQLAVQQLIQRAAIIEEFVARRRERGTQPTTAAAPVRWHMIGSLQRNKVKQAVDATRLIHSVDSLRLAEELQDYAEERGSAPGGEKFAPVDVLIEVNVAGERAKHGCAPAAARHLVDMIDTMVALRPRGLMCMAPAPKPGEPANLDDARRVFIRCQELFEEIRALGSGGTRFDILSMGMSDDFEVAIECGSNMVRVGSAIFGEAKPGEGEEAED